jgi:hypothetical protein
MWQSDMKLYVDIPTKEKNHVKVPSLPSEISRMSKSMNVWNKIEEVLQDMCQTLTLENGVQDLTKQSRKMQQTPLHSYSNLNSHITQMFYFYFIISIEYIYVNNKNVIE